MIYLGLALVIPALWFGFWWLLVPVSFGLGYSMKGLGGRWIALGSGLAWAALAFVRDGQNSHGVIAGRMAGMFSLPGAWAFYILLILIGFLTSILWFRAGREVRLLINR